MDIKQFLEELKKLKIENNASTGIQQVPNVLQKMQELLPGWFYFIDQTGIGEKQELLDVLADVINATDAQDGIFLADALLFGLRELIKTYEFVIEEALHGE